MKRLATIQRTTITKAGQQQPSWFVVDAQGQILGRLASKVAMILMGKHRPGYTAHVDTGDFVVITNAEKIRVTGHKAEQKEYDYYTYYMGGRKVVPYAQMKREQPEKVVSEAIRRMLPKNKLGRHMFKKLKVYRGGAHPHAAQQPEELKLN
jgi:large subunit ribosomal protein L13